MAVREINHCPLVILRFCAKLKLAGLYHLHTVYVFSAFFFFIHLLDPLEGIWMFFLDPLSIFTRVHLLGRFLYFIRR